MTIVVASENPAKIAAVRAAFARAFPAEAPDITAVRVPSGVRDQPMSIEEARQGAQNRALQARDRLMQAAFWVGLEGGIEDTAFGMVSTAWVCVTNGAMTGYGNSGQFILPERIASLVRTGKELGEADDIVFGRTNSKQAEGAIGILSQGLITRSDALEHATIAALIPFMNPELYSG